MHINVYRIIQAIFVGTSQYNEAKPLALLGMRAVIGPRIKGRPTPNVTNNFYLKRLTKIRSRRSLFKIPDIKVPSPTLRWKKRGGGQNS